MTCSKGKYRLIIKKCQSIESNCHVRMLENHGCHFTSLSASLFHVVRWKSRSALLGTEVPKRLDGSTPPEFEVMNLSCPKTISDMITAMELQRPKMTLVLPQWNLGIVLEALSKTLYEPLREALKHLTLKTVPPSFG